MLAVVLESEGGDAPACRLGSRVRAEAREHDPADSQDGSELNSGTCL